jgi:hypothetical protein
MWGRLHKYRWAIYRDNLVIYNEMDNLCVMPLGEDITSTDLLHLSDTLNGQGRKGNFCFVPTELAEGNRELENHFSLELDEDNADYIYSTRKLFELKGKKLHKKKNLLKQFQNQYPDYTCHKGDPDHYHECINLMEKWCEDKTCDIVSYAYEAEALRTGCAQFLELGMEGLILQVENRTIAFAVFNQLNSNTALVHFEKYDREYKGAGQAINWETAKYLMDRYDYVNREQDLGIPGLRQAKQSYQPDQWTVTYRLIRK